MQLRAPGHSDFQKGTTVPISASAGGASHLNSIFYPIHRTTVDDLLPALSHKKWSVLLLDLPNDCILTPVYLQDAAAKVPVKLAAMTKVHTQFLPHGVQDLRWC